MKKKVAPPIQVSWKEKILRFLFSYGELIVIGGIFFLLLCRNPFSTRTLIPNLEPYPDSIHYISPALSLLRGEGLFLSREGRHLLPNVPPMYSLALLPAFVINQDVRMFYFMNVVLAFVGLALFGLILQKVFPKQRWLRFVLLFFYVTNYLLYWFPELAMAENLLLPLMLAGVYLLLLPVTRKTAVAIVLIAVALYSTKFASLPLAVAFPFLFGIKLLRQPDWNKKREIGGAFLALSLVGGGAYVGYEYLTRHTNVLQGLLSLLFSTFAPDKIQMALKGQGTGGFFSLQYAGKNIGAYGGWLLGNDMFVLHKQLHILPKYLALPAFISLFLSLFTKRRWIACVWLVLLAVTIFLLMSFYAADGRYFMIAIPAIIVGVGLFLNWIHDTFPHRGPLIANVLLTIFFVVYAISNLMRLKFDIMLNLKYAENPWYYTSVRVFDEYLANHRAEFQRPPVIISALPPYIIDFYAKQPMVVLPLDSNQEFRSHQQVAWGNYNFQDLPGEYQRLFEAGHPVFLTKYGLGNEKYLQNAFEALFKRFTFTKVAEGCFSLCDVYQVTGLQPSPTPQPKR